MKTHKKVLYLYTNESSETNYRIISKVLSQLVDEARSKSISTTTIYRKEAELNGALKNAALILESDQEKLVHFIENWVGTIKWIGKSEFRKEHVSKEWFINCQELNTKEAFDNVPEYEMKFTAIRASGAGGQHVNKVSTAVRAVHEPTGLQVLTSDSRSQSQNKLLAIERLSKLVQEHKLNTLINDIKTMQLNQVKEQLKLVRTITGTDFKSKSVNKSYKGKRKSDNQKDWRNTDY